MATPGLSGKPLRDRTVFKMSLGASGTNEAAEVFKYCLENQRVLLGWGDAVDFTGCRDEAEIRQRVHETAPSIEKPDSVVRYVNYFMHELKVGDLIVASHGNRAFRGIAEVTGAYEYAEDGPFQQARPVKWLAVFEGGRVTSEVNAKDFTMSSLYKLAPAAINFDALQSLVAPKETTDETEHHVLIIDEINRANISKVFGELITLLEPDKREGAANAITLKLPYSGEDFAVPSNLHVLGTMNTADRSIALLDTALRRRFDFEELMPRPGELRGLSFDGVELERLLTTLNERVEALYDRDHTIGHAFFMEVRSLSDLESVFRRKVLPLLQEYFYERWSDIRRVLNDLGEGDFVRKRTLPQVSPDGDEPYPDEPRVVYSVNEVSFPTAAYQRIYGA
jgi:5-methylcytosine-specific restriction protein B